MLVGKSGVMDLTFRLKWANQKPQSRDKLCVNELILSKRLVWVEYRQILQIHMLPCEKSISFIGTVDVRAPDGY